MLAETVLRAAHPQFTAPIVVTNQDHRFVVAEQLRNAGIRGGQILLEPAGRNSAPAIAAAALLAAQLGTTEKTGVIIGQVSQKGPRSSHDRRSASLSTMNAPFFVPTRMRTLSAILASVSIRGLTCRLIST